MFGLKKNSSIQKTQSSNTESTTEKFVITTHTMRDDLYSLTQPSSVPQTLHTTETSYPSETNSPLSKDQKIPQPQLQSKNIGNSPFLKNSAVSYSKDNHQDANSLNNALNSNILPSANSDKNHLLKNSFDNNSLRLALYIGVPLIIILIVAGSFFFFFSRTVTKEELSDSVLIPTLPTISDPVIQNTYSSEKPNVLSLDIESVSQSDLTNRFLSIVTDINSGQSNATTSPIEFILTDLNNNPIAFARFALLFNLSLPEEIISQLDENFSLYFYNDRGIVRLGLRIKTNNIPTLAPAFLELEKKSPRLVDMLSPLFLNTPYIQTKDFQESLYNMLTIRFINLNQQETLSLDYVFTNTDLYIGTSKSLIRAIYDKNQSR